MALLAPTRQGHWASTLVKIAPWMAALAAICLTTAAYGDMLDCRPAGASDYSDPLSRDGLSTVICDLPEPGEVLLIVTDPNLSWPVLITPKQTVSFEEDMLGNKLGIPGLPYFNPELDQVILFTDPERLFISFTINDPITLDPARVWLRIDTLTGRLSATL